MKKILAIMFSMALIFSMVACATTETPEVPTDESSEEPVDVPEEGGHKLALITDIGTIDDKSFNQGSWEGLVQYAEEHGLTHKYYQPSDKSTVAYLSAIELAVTGGAEVIVTPGFLFEEAVFQAQSIYPEVSFIFVDGAPVNESGEQEIADNTVGIVYAEEEVGFLAGYAAVKEGYTNLGFMGGMAVPAVIRFGHGYIQGADYAAKELGIDNVDVKYHYTGNFDATPEAQTLAASWYQDGVEAIFACGGAVGNSVMTAAEAADGKVIGVDIDQSGESDTVITSATKALKESVYSMITKLYTDEWPGGTMQTYGASTNGVELPMETSKFATFTQADYDAIYEKLAAGEIAVVGDDVEDENAIVVENVTVTSVK